MSIEKIPPHEEEPKSNEGEDKEKENSEDIDERRAKEKLLDAAEKLNYDDKCGGEAISTFKEELKEIANHIEELESAGYTIKVKCFPESNGGASVHLERNGESVQIYSRFYDQYSRGFNDYGVYQVRKDIAMALKFPKLFKEDTSN